MNVPKRIVQQYLLGHELSIEMSSMIQDYVHNEYKISTVIDIVLNNAFTLLQICRSMGGGGGGEGGTEQGTNHDI